jgi:Tfp pilus assembly protein PilN
MKRISLNLATSPLRNRRLFLFLGGLLGLAILVSAFLAGLLFLRFTLKKRAVQSSLKKTRETILQNQREAKRLSTKSKEAAQRDKGTVDQVNSIILKKSFSWTEFLSKLEECLPDSSYILSLAPTLAENSTVQFRFRVVSQSLDDLLKLINNLQAQKFSTPRVENEERNERGQLVSEISVSYERNI